ncbi:MAG: flavin reductase family protein [Trueperaceae bacterium]|nr:flavin reductase family protein [Trueperaceae bacterium]
MTFDLEALDFAESYRLLVSTVVPRPIALVTTLDEDGTVNAAPFSFFNVMGHDPPTLVLGIEGASDGGSKDTPRNVRRRREFGVGLVNEPMAARMNVCAVPFPAGTSELVQAGLEPVAADKIDTPLVHASPVRLECLEAMSIGVGRGRTLVIGTIVALHLDDAYWDADARRVRTEGLGLIGRMEGDWYVRTTDRFRMSRLTPEQF